MGKKRSPIGVLLLAIITFGIYFFVWYYKTNREMMEVTQQPWGVGLWTFLLFIPIANFVSVYKMADQIHRAHLAKGVTGMGTVPIFLLMVIPLVSIVGVPMAQSQMNKLWA